MLEQINHYVWNSGLLVLLLGTGLLVSVRIRFFQVRSVRQILRNTFGSLRSGNKDGGKTVSQWKICTAALAASMGTGNIVGVTAALSIGGAGAIFWMWVSALLGMALTYAENVLAMRFRKQDDPYQGPMAYLRHGVGSRVLAGFYAVCCILASLGMGNLTQGSAAAETMQNAFSVPNWCTGLVIMGILFYAVLGGMRSIGNVTRFLLPLVSVAYMGLAVAVLVRHAADIPAALGRIFGEAFGLRQAGGAAVGVMISAGLRHGVFSNEAGLGSSALIHSHADDAPEQRHLQGMWSMIEVFLDTIVCCTLTALAVLTTSKGAVKTGTGAICAAFGEIVGDIAPACVAVMVTTFAVCTMLGWSCCGETAVRSISPYPAAVKCYRVAFCMAGGIGSIAALQMVWTISDIANGLMAVPNLLGLLVLLKFVDIPHDMT